MGTLMCPMAHGVDCNADVFHKPAAWRKAGWSVEDIEHFINWWDGGSYDSGLCDERYDKLSKMIDSLWQERLEDADAVQEVLEQEPLVEEQPCLSNVPMVSVSQL